jgi:hypothetical protein
MVEYDEEEEEYENDEYADDEEEAEDGEGPSATSENRSVAEKLTLAVLIALSITGVAIADFSTRFGLQYWLCMVPVFGLTSVFVSWKGERSEGSSVFRILGWQIMHWTPLALAIYLVFFLEQAGRLNREDAGLVSLLLLTVTTLSAGVHFDWRLLVVGLLLGVTTACVAFVEEFVWILLIAGVVAGGAVYLWPRRKNRLESNR